MDDELNNLLFQKYDLIPDNIKYELLKDKTISLLNEYQKLKNENIKLKNEINTLTQLTLNFIKIINDAETNIIK